MQISAIEPQTPGARAMIEARHHNLLIGGQWVAASNGETFETRDPASGKLLGLVARGSADDIDHAVACARKALHAPSWRDLTPPARCAILARLADLMEAEIDALAELETLDQGKPLAVGRWAEIPGAIAQFRYFAACAGELEGRVIPSGVNYQPPGKKVFSYTLKEPVGVVGAIVPWNSPLVLTCMKLAPALAAGCTVVLKPAEDTSLTAIRLAQLAMQAGLPDGVLNLVTGYGYEAGAALAAHPDVDKIAFTGSTATGRRIVEASAQSNLKKVSLELGGKSPVIVCADADIDAAMDGAANAIFFNGGQVCVAGSRLYVERPVFDRFISGIAARARQIVLGHGLDPDTQMGPLVSAAHASRVVDYLRQGKAAGAEAVVGGDWDEGDGAFVRPTVFTGVTSDMAIVREEIFGPVLVASPFDDLDEALSLANDSRYGLASSVWTQSLSKAHHAASALEAGTVWINTHSMYDASLPIGGRKQSGWGRDSGHQALDSYLESKTVCAVL